MKLKHIILLFCFFSVLPYASKAQLTKYIKGGDIDTNYISDYFRDLGLRLYGSRKFTGYRLGNYGYKNRLIYYPNSNQNIGFGFQYKFLGLNIGFRVPYMNDDIAKYGKTKYLDLQSYILLRNFTLDVYGQFYRGYYLSNREFLTQYPAFDTFLYRPDMRINNFGMNAYYIFNNKRFSYRAAFIHNEYQKKSAGSLLAGAGVHYFDVKADSTIIPSNIAYTDFYNNNLFNKSGSLSLSVNGGYGYTMVLHQHFFIMASALGGLGINYTRLTDSYTKLTDKGVGLQLTASIRAAAGYNSERYFAGVHYVNFITRNSTPVANAWQQFEAGNLRFSVVRRFKLKKPLPKPLPYIFGKD